MCRFEVEGSPSYSGRAAVVDVTVGAALIFAAAKMLGATDCTVEDSMEAPAACKIGVGLGAIGVGLGVAAIGFLYRPSEWKKPEWQSRPDKPCPNSYSGVGTLQYISDAGGRDLQRKPLAGGRDGYALSIPVAEVFSAKLHTNHGTLWLRKSFPDLGKTRDPPMLAITQALVEGNGNRALDARESGKLAVTIKNHGKGDAFVTVQLTPQREVPGVLVVTPTQVLRVPAGGELDLPLPVTATGEVPDARFTATLAVTDVRGTGEARLPVEFRTRRERLPRIAFKGVVVDDSMRGQTAGDTNGQVDSGEEVLLVLSFTNLGEAPADDVALQVTGTSEVYVVKQFPPLGCRSLDVGATYEEQVLVNVAKRYTADGPLPLRYRFIAKPAVLLEGPVPISRASPVPGPIHMPIPTPDPEIERRCPR
jgi:hypothetical protein